ncbi:TPA: hypothetical protein DEP94_03540 [Candidatus Nomurabacteria bacterium]|nr:hypothetical protein [Candidatus Nomurabacteria bacterium]
MGEFGGVLLKKAYIPRFSEYKDSGLTKPNKKSIIKGRGAMSFNKVFVRASALMRGLHKGCIKGCRRIIHRTLGYFVTFINKGKMMKTNSLSLKLSAITLATGVFILLTACGGGGGGSTPNPTPNPTPATGSVTANACTVPDGAGACGISVVWTSSNASLPRVTLNGVSVSSLANGSGTFSISLGTTTVAVADGTTVLASVNTFATCGINSVAVNGVCQPVVNGYDKILVGIRFGRPGIIDPSGATPWVEATNNTSYKTGAIPIFNGYVSEAPLPDCSYLELVQTASDGDLHFIKHNLKTNVVTDFTGTVPAGYEVTRTGPSSWTIGAKWHNTHWGTAPFSYMFSWGQDVNGNYAYTDFTDDRILRKQTAAGVQSVVYTSTDSGSFSVINSVTCH